MHGIGLLGSWSHYLFLYSKEVQDGAHTVAFSPIPRAIQCRKSKVRRDETSPDSSACEVGWPVPFLATFITPVLLPLGVHMMLDEQ